MPDDRRPWTDQPSADAPADGVLVFNGRIHLLDGSPRTVDAVAMRGGRVAATGTTAAAEAALGPAARRIDLQGAVAIPGLVDCHPHLLHLATRAAGYVDLGDVRSHDDVVQRFRERAAVTPKGQWLIGTPIGEPYYFIARWYTDLDERVMPDRHVLDRASTEHPIFISAWAPRTPNVVAFNTAGLRAVHITDFIPERVCDVWIDKDEAGGVTGVLRGSVNNYYCYDPFWTQILRRLPPVYPPDLLGPTREAIRRYNATGVTTVYEAHNMTPEHIEAYRALRADGSLTMRVKAGLEVEQYAFAPWQPKSMAEFEQSLARALALCDDGTDDLLRVTDATLSDGGPCWSGHLHMREDYRDPYGRPTRGTRFISLPKKARFAHFCCTHGIRASWVNAGYGDHDDCLRVLEADRDTLGLPARSMMLQHGYVVSPEQAARYRALGFDFTTSMSFSWAKGDVYGERIGTQVWKDLVPLARLDRLGFTLGLGSDWGPKNAPFEHMELAQTHRFAGSGRRNDGPDQAVSRRRAIEMWTRDAGRALQWNGVGTLAVGAYADLVALDRDPFDCPLPDLAQTRARMTLLGARIVHTDGTLA